MLPGPALLAGAPAPGIPSFPPPLIPPIIPPGGLVPTPCVDSNPDDDDDECGGNGGDKPPRPPAVPEPEGWLLLALAGLAVGWAFRRGPPRRTA